MAGDKGRSGIDGWLFVFLALVGVVTPLHHIARMVDITGYAFNFAKQGEMSPAGAFISWFFFAIIAVGAIALSIWIVRIMWRKRVWSTIKNVLVALWILYLVPPVADTVVGMFVLSYSVTDVIIVNASALAWGVVFAFAGMVYLTSATRVANTYLKPNSVRQIDDTFG